MNNKTVIIIASLILVVVSLIIGNNIVGAQVAKSVDGQLQVIFTENAATAPFQFEYDEVKANPLGRSVTIIGFKMHGTGVFPMDMEASSVKLKMPLSQILEVAKNKDLKSINNMSIDLQNPVFKSEDSEAKFVAESMKLSFNGEASLFEMERMDQGILPSTKQSIDLHFKDMGWENIEDMMLELPEELKSAFGSKYSQSGDFRLALAYDPDKKQINLKRWEVNNKRTNIKGQALLNFTGNTFEDFEPKNGHIKMSYALSQFIDAKSDLGEFSLEKAEVILETDLDFEKASDNLASGDITSLTPIKNLSYSMNVEGLKLASAENLNDIFPQLGTSITFETFSMNKMTLDFEIANKEMELNTLTIQVDDMIDIEGSAKMEYQTLPNQRYDGVEDEVLVFEKAHLEIESKSNEIDELIQMLEETMPKPFPRKNGKIIIDLSGPLSKPTIKGVTD